MSQVRCREGAASSGGFFFLIWRLTDGHGGASGERAPLKSVPSSEAEEEEEEEAVRHV